MRVASSTVTLASRSMSLAQRFYLTVLAGKGVA
jgi:hypothetical protein